MSITADEARQWLLESHAASATYDTDYWLDNFFSPNVTLIYANMLPITGRDNCKLLFHSFLSRLSNMTHYIKSFDFISSENKILQAAGIEYQIKGDPEGKVIQIPGFAAFTLERDGEGKIRLLHSQTWLDPSPVVERIMAVHGKEEWEKEMETLMQRIIQGN